MVHDQVCPSDPQTEAPHGVPPMKITKAPESPGWVDTLPIDLTLPLEHDTGHGPAFEESLTGLHVRELIGAGLFERLFGPRPPAPPR